MSPLIVVWLGPEYELSRTFVFLISLASFMNLCRSTTDQFVSGYGIFGDIWAPISEISIYVISALILGPLYGLNGLVMAPIISLGIVLYVWKPYWLFSRGFKISVLNYWILISRYLIPVIIIFILVPLVCGKIMTYSEISSGWWQLIMGGLLYLSVSFLLIVVVLGVFFKEMRAFLKRFIKR